MATCTTWLTTILEQEIVKANKKQSKLGPMVDWGSGQLTDNGYWEGRKALAKELLRAVRHDADSYV